MDTISASDPNDGSELSVILIALFKGVLYQEDDPARWNRLLNLQNRVRDYVTILGLELILDDAEGYAFLRARQQESNDTENAANSDNTEGGTNIPRLIARRPLSFPVSLLLALLRKKLAEADAGGGDTRLILNRDEILELIRVFLPASSNEAKLTDQLDRHINKVVELGFLRKLDSGNHSGLPHYEVRRIIKAFVDAQWLADLDRRLAQYQTHFTETHSNAGN
ncbi:MAG TPA: DUF4194 domain-containing protein [Nitrosomonas sp.]|nr:DUF4194 domain-containing protein [Nitrosomonas sp.]